METIEDIIAKWNGESVEDISDLLKENPGVKRKLFNPDNRAPSDIRDIYPNIIAIDHHENMISDTGELIVNYSLASWQKLHSKKIDELVSVVYPDSVMVRDETLGKVLLKSGKYAYCYLSRDYFVIIVAKDKKSLPGPRTSSLLSFYSGNDCLIDQHECKTLVAAIDEAIFKEGVLSISEGL
jgi:hypothetical protein